MSLKIIVNKKLGDFNLNIDFSTNNNLTSILGKSGCGKSMTLKCIAGIEKPDKGHISVNGKILFDSEKKINLPPQKRNIGFMFQNYALFPHMTIEENIKCGFKNPKGEKENNKTKEIMNQLKINGLEKRYPSQISGGQSQRVALGRILVYEPEILLLDEPFSALDFNLKEELQIELLNILEDYTGDILMVTHNRDEAYNLSEEILVIDKGKVLNFGKTKEVFENPKLLEVGILTGCKNYSKIKKYDDFNFKALDWDWDFKLKEKIPEDINYIGIRAHDFIPIYNKSDSNFKATIIPKYIKKIDNCFEQDIIFKNSNGNLDSKKLWWKKNKDLKKLPEKLGVNNLLFLKG